MSPQDCQRLSTAFYARVALNPVLRPLFPGKTFTCAINEFAAFLMQFLNTGGNDQKRWWLSLRESHARFKLTPEHRAAWLACMQNACADTDLLDFFRQTSKYLIHQEPGPLKSPELAKRWTAQTMLDALVAAVRSNNDDEAIALADYPDLNLFHASVRCGILSLMLRSNRPRLHDHAAAAIQSDAQIIRERFAGRTLLHNAAASGNLRFVELLLTLGSDPNAADGVKHCTPLHMAARRGHNAIAEALLAGGADINARDTKGDTPLMRARNCRQPAIWYKGLK